MCKFENSSIEKIVVPPRNLLSKSWNLGFIDKQQTATTTFSELCTSLNCIKKQSVKLRLTSFLLTLKFYSFVARPWHQLFSRISWLDLKKEERLNLHGLSPRSWRGEQEGPCSQSCPPYLGWSLGGEKWVTGQLEAWLHKNIFWCYLNKKYANLVIIPIKQNGLSKSLAICWPRTVDPIWWVFI